MTDEQETELRQELRGYGDTSGDELWCAREAQRLKFHHLPGHPAMALEADRLKDFRHKREDRLVAKFKKEEFDG